MKINIELDVSPEEIRQLYGLPDLSAIHKKLSDTINETVSQGDGTALSSLLLPMMSTGMNPLESYQKFLNALFEKVNAQQTKSESEEH